MVFKQLNDIITEIANEPKTNNKIALLQKYENVPHFKDMLQFALNARMQFRMKKLPIFEEAIPQDCEVTFEGMLDVLSQMANLELSGNAAKATIASMMARMTTDQREILTKLLHKDLRCGVNAKTVNKAFGSKFLPVEPYMRCSLLSEKTIKNIKSLTKDGRAVLEVKMDGQYLNHTCRNGEYIATSRNGVEHDFLSTKDEIMSQLADTAKQLYPEYFTNGVVFQGECLVYDDNGDFLQRTTGNGIVQKAGENTISVEEAKRVVFVLWDIVSFDGYNKNIFEVPRKQRLDMLTAVLNANPSRSVKLIEHYVVSSVKEALAINTDLMLRGEEGSVLKCDYGIWKAGTSTTQIKMKLFMEVDLQVIDFIEGTGKFTNMLGALRCKSADGKVVVNIGGGFKEKKEKGVEWTREEIWNNREKLMNMVVTATFTDIVVDKFGNTSLLHGRFVEFRFDKDTCDDLPRIYEIKNGTIEEFTKLLEQKIK